MWCLNASETEFTEPQMGLATSITGEREERKNRSIKPKVKSTLSNGNLGQDGVWFLPRTFPPRFSQRADAPRNTRPVPVPSSASGHFETVRKEHTLPATGLRQHTNSTTARSGVLYGPAPSSLAPPCPLCARPLSSMAPPHLCLIPPHPVWPRPVRAGFT